jgi:O-antigen/teichoic acid export membrane protein
MAAGMSSAETADVGTRLGRVGAHTFLFNGLSLVVNLVSGIIVARGIGVAGRGELSAITTIAVVGVWIVGMGCIPATSFHVARHPEDAGRLLGTWLTMIVPIGLLGICAVELVCPVLLAAQRAHTVALARLYVLTMLPSLMYQVAYGVLLGDHDFLFVNAVSFVRFAGVALGYGVLAVVGHLEVTLALALTAAVDLSVCAAALRRAIRRHGVAAPNLALGRHTLWYGFRAHGTQVGGIVTGRIDLLMLPAFLGAASVGLYSVATNVSWIVFTLANALAVIVLPAAARHEAQRTTILVAAMYATLLAAVVMGGILALAAQPAVRLVYGAAFSGSCGSIRLLLPGTIAYAVAAVLGAGLYALERPGLAAAAQAPGIVITVVGLLLFLKHGGIVAASIVSSIAYSSVLVTSLVLYRSAAHLTWSDFLARPRDLQQFLRLAPGVAGREQRQAMAGAAQ